MKRFFVPLFVFVLLLPMSALGQGKVQGPFPVQEDSILVTVTGVKLNVIGSGLNLEGVSTPRLMPTGSRRARVWFAIGLLKNSCRIRKIQRTSSDAVGRGATVHNVTFKCHYDATEFKSDIRELIQK